jgi:glycosyltransferase involved in cell wall biosynthesis
MRPGAKVVFTGRREDVPAVTAALDVAVLPSYREAQGLVILEAMALSRPVVASNVGGIPEMITDGVTGLLVPPHDPPALAAAIVAATTQPYAGARRPDLVHERFSSSDRATGPLRRRLAVAARSAGAASVA